MVPVAVQMATIYQESKFIGNARTPRQYALGVIPMGRQSSAYGYSQALDGTWEEYVDEVGGWGKSRDDIDDATDFMGWYMHQTTVRLGIPKTDARNQYLAYHEGRAGYARGSYKAKSWRHIATIHPCIGYSDERIEIFLAHGLSYVGHERDHEEFLEVIELSLADAIAAIRDGEITDGKTVAGLLWAEKIISNAWPLPA